MKKDKKTWSGHSFFKKNAVELVTPSSMYAGVIPYINKKDIMSAVFNAAAYSLDNDEVRLIISVQEDVAYYLACKASEFSDVSEESTTPLVMALPGMPGHQGDGVYVSSDSEGQSIAISLLNGKIESFHGTSLQIEKFIDRKRSEQMEIYRLVQQDPELIATLPVWQGYREYQREEVRRIFTILTALAVLVIALTTAVWGFASVYHGRQVGKMNNIREKVEHTASMNLSLVQRASIKSNALAEFQKVSAFAIENNGFIVNYRITDGKNNWEMKLPINFPEENLVKVFGTSVTMQRDSNNIIVRRN